MKKFEIERVFLIKRLPKEISRDFVRICVGDFYDSNSLDALKLKQKGDNYHLIKKVGSPLSRRTEHIIEIKKGEFDALWKATIQNHEKIRFYHKIRDALCEIDYIKDVLKVI